MNKALVPFHFLLFAYLCAAGVRYHQYLEIKTSPDYRAGTEIILTNHDGYRWLRFAKGEYSGTGDDLSAALKPPYRPLISVMLSKIDPGLMSVFVPGLFIFPLGIFFMLAGFPAAGVGAGLAGSLAFAYLGRTSAYQIDTDMLNLFFVSLGALLLLLAERGRSVLWSAALGLSMYLFWRWYFHSGFTVVYFALLLYALRHRGGRVIFASAAVYILCASPFVFANGFRGLFEFAVPAAAVRSDVSELAVYGFSGTLRTLNPFWWLALAGTVLSLFTGRRGVYLSVFYALGVLAFFKGNRFAMYLAPMYGAGLGIASDYILRRRGGALAQALTVFLVMFSSRGYFRFIPPPVVSPGTYGLINKINNTENNSVAAVLWDYGFLTEYLAGRSSIADGASQYRQGAKLYAQALFQTDSVKSAEMLNEAASDRPVYLVLTPDMDAKLGSLIKTAGLRAVWTGGDDSTAVSLVSIDNTDDENAVRLTETVYFRLHVIGLADIPCFKMYARSGEASAVYSVGESCIKTADKTP